MNDETEGAVSRYCFLDMVWGKTFLGEMVRTLTLGKLSQGRFVMFIAEGGWREDVGVKE